MRGTHIRPAYGFSLLAAFLIGCFTEVGNAEDERLVQARFSIDYVPPSAPAPKLATVKSDSASVSILNFRLLVREAEFHLYDSTTGRREEYHIWKDDTVLLPVDFTGRDTEASLPEQKVGVLNPQNLKLECVLPARTALNPDTLDFEGFQDPAYLKGYLKSGKDSSRFLFALPKAGEFELIYNQGIVASWYASGVYHCAFTFYANRWIRGVNVSGASSYRDRRGAPILIFDPEHNGSLHKSLEAGFKVSFNASSVNYAPAAP